MTDENTFPADPALDDELSRLAAAITIGSDAPPHPDRVVDMVMGVLPDSDYASLTVIQPRSRPRTLASTDPLPSRIDEIQYDLHEGPCLEAIDTDDYVRTDDLTDEPRWPVFGPKAAATAGIHSMLSVRLALPGETRASLNLYARDRAVFTEHDVAVAALLSGYAGISVALAMERERSENLELALTGSRQIGMAMGILMSSKLLTADQAFEELRHASQYLHRKVRDIAGEVMETGTLPDLPDRR